MYVDPDENYMIISVDHHPLNVSQEWGDLYITYRLDKTRWSEAIPLGSAINTAAHENCPQVTPDGRFLIFNRYDPETERSESYWLDSALIETLKQRIVQP
ncbi:MAG: hypothetical protein GY906_15175 [bacterium]|nr:hypothetical protein [bacterium]